jgi:hypothetical protein
MGLEEALGVLALEPGADADAVARAFRAAIKRVHPDRPGGDGEALRRVIEAHRVLAARPRPRTSPDIRDGKVGRYAWRTLDVDEKVLSRGGAVTLEAGRAPVWLTPEARRFGVMRMSGGADGDLIVRLRPAPSPPSAFDAKRQAFAASWAA